MSRAAKPQDQFAPISGACNLAPAAHLPGLAVRAHDWRDFDTREMIGQWDALAQCAAQPNPFYESWYLLPSLQQLDPGHSVRLLTMEVDGQLAGVMPVRRYDSYYGYPLPHLRNWVHPNCFCGEPLVARGLEAHFWRAVLEWSDRNCGLALFLHLAQLPEDGAIHRALKQIVAQHHRPAATVLREERALLNSELSSDAYLEQSLSTKKRKELRRQKRRLEELGKVTIRHERHGEGLDAWIEDFLALERKGWKGREGSALGDDEANARLFRDALGGADQRGMLDRITLDLDSRPIAMLASFLHPPGAYSFKTAFDEDYARFSPGVLLQLENLTVLDDPAIAWTDSCAAQDHQMIDHIWRERRAISCHSIAIGGAVRTALFKLLAKRETGRPAEGIA